MPDQTLRDAYNKLSLTHNEYSRNRERWEFLLNSYLGGKEYRNGGYLTRYQLETAAEYAARLDNTPLDNHCNNVISTYVSFLFRESPDRDFGSWVKTPDIEDFLKDCDYEGRSLDSFMKNVSIWSAVFGHCWVLLTKPNVGATTVAEEQALGLRPYLNLMTPMVVSDWRWERSPIGSYVLNYIKYVEEVIDNIVVVKEWTPEIIRTWIMDEDKKEAYLNVEEVNQLGMIPAILVYNQRGISKGVGVSDIADIADIQRQIYNLHSENEQAIRMDGHPTLVTPPTAQLGSGAGALIVLQEGSDPGLNPYYLEAGGSSIANIHSSIDKLVEAIDRISFTGGVRTTKTESQSGVALETEFQLLNSKLAEKADNLELAEEQIWKLYGFYQGREWDGDIHYPESFNIRDTQREISQLVAAKSAATDPRVLNVIDHELLEALGEDPDLILTTPEYLPAESLPPTEPFEPHIMIDPDTGEEVIARTEEEHLSYAAAGYIHEAD